MSTRRTILAVFAHPDDEAYGPGGTLAHYALSGTDVYMLTFTCGEAGSIGISRTLPTDELCRRRTAELREASEALRLRGHRLVGEPDGQLASMDREKGIEIVLDEFRRRRPQVVITFHHGGVSRHPDHLAVYRFVKEAFARAGDDSPDRVFGWCMPESLSHVYRGERDVDFAAESEIAARISIPDEAMDRKIEAIESHRTQIEFFGQLQEWFENYREVTGTEHFELIEGKAPLPRAVITDLFEGLES